MGAVNQADGSWLSERRLRVLEAASLLPIVLLLGVAAYTLLRSGGGSDDDVLLRFFFVAWPFASGGPVVLVSLLSGFRYVRDDFTVSNAVVGLLCVYTVGWFLVLGTHLLFGINTAFGGLVTIVGIALTVLASLALAAYVVVRSFGSVE